MKIRDAILLICMLVLIASCKSETRQQKETVPADPTSLYEYRVGLGYGFLGKVVQVTIDSYEVISIVGTDEIEEYAQLQGTKMLASGSTPNKDIMVRVTVDGGQPHEQSIDLSAGMFVHVYLEQTGLRVYNTRFLVQE
jgi:hypothetical protein